MGRLFLFGASLLTLGSPVFGQEDFLENLSLSTILSFESKYIFRGEEQGKESFQPSLEAGHPLGPGDLYVGIWASQDISGDPSDEVDFYAGYSLPLTPIFAISGGFTYYWYPDEGSVPSHEEEPYLGIYADLPLQPAAFVYYNFALEQLLLELSVGEGFTLTEKSLIRTGLSLGLAQANDANSDQVSGKPHNSYGYFQVYADLVYEFNPISSASLGIRYSGREDSGYTDYLYWGASVSFGF
ncbi:MAG: TorF family putative porin [Puniceicoccales bacterium]